MKSHVKNTFRDQEIVIDASNAYVSCKFVKCHLIYLGGDFSLLNCNIDNCQITITGEAGKTVAFMQAVGMIVPPQPPPSVAQLPESGTLH